MRRTAFIMTNAAKDELALLGTELLPETCIMP